MAVPVLITVYDRINHFKQTVESLKTNVLAKNTDLFVAIDYPLIPNDINLSINKAIINYCQSLDGFRSIELIIREKNHGAFGNVLDSQNTVLSSYDALIFSEDDNVFARTFLSYMNNGVEYYRDDKKIASVCAYLEPLDAISFGSADVFFRQGFTSNGFVLWRHKNIANLFGKASIFERKLSFYEFYNYVQSVGSHVAGGLIYAYANKRFYWDYLVCDYLYRNDMKCIFPARSLVRNIGQDGSGLHSGTNTKLMSQEIWDIDEIFHISDMAFTEKLNLLVSKYHRRSIIHTVWKYYQYIMAFSKDGC